MPMQVEDAVEASLVKEVDCIRDYQHKMKLLVEVMVKQVDSNCQAQKLLVTDIRNKVGGGFRIRILHEKISHDQKISANIDGICEKLTNKSGELESHSRIQNLLVNKSVPESWNRDSQNNVQISRNARSVDI